MQLEFSVVGKKLTLINAVPIVTGEANVTECVFNFDSSWDGYTKTVIFQTTATDAVPLVLEDGVNSCIVPPEITSYKRVLYIGLYGMLGTAVLNTNWYKQSLVDGAKPNFVPAPTESVYAQIINIMQTQKADAQTAIDKALEASTSANNAKQSEDNAKVSEDNAKQSETNASNMYTQIVTEEDDRQEAEVIRGNSEVIRIQNENQRATAEQSRVTAEQSRNTAEQTRGTNETQRQQEEVNRSNTFNTFMTNSSNQFQTKYNGLEAEYAAEITGVKSQLSQTEIEINMVSDKVDSLFVTKEYNKLLSFLTSATYLSMDGIEKATDGVKVAMITVEAGETYEVCSKLGGEVALYGIYDGNGTLINYFNDGNKTRANIYVTDTITIPENGKKMKIESYYGYENSYCKQIAKVAKPYSNSPLKDKKWVAYGDSLTDPITLQGKKNYVDFITDETGSYTVNLGYGGSGFLKNQNYYGRVNTVPLDANVITVYGSFNDFSYIANNLGTADDDGNVATPTTLGSAMNKFLINLYARCPNIKVGFISPIPWKWYNPYTATNKAASESYVALMKAVAEKWSIPYYDMFHNANIRIWETSVSQEFTINNDGTHLTEEGHRQYIYKKVKAFLESIC